MPALEAPRPIRARSRAVAATGALAVALLLSVLGTGPVEARRPDADSPGISPGGSSLPCTPVLARAMPMSRAVEIVGAPALAAANDSSAAAVRRDVAAGEAHADDSRWADRCGRAFYADADLVDEAALDAGLPARSAAALAPLGDTFTLHSRPGADQVIYLDFDGETVTGTGWNQSSGRTSFTVAPFSMTAPADTAFSNDELSAVQLAWAAVAEDYAPWDIDVTTEKPSGEALMRDSASDPRFGQTFVLTDTAPMRDTCGCAGVAYVDTWDEYGSIGRYYHYAWGFTSAISSGASLDAVASFITSVASHEIGHTLSLDHDGVGSNAYSNGFQQWAPIMGVSQGRPVGQWSNGSYTGATNTQDDLARISARAPLLADDVPGTAAGAVPLSSGAPQVRSITTTVDTDAFAFTGTGSGSTTVSVTPTATTTNLDASLRILDGNGQSIALVNPVSTRLTQTTAGGMGASWTGTVPSGTTYVAIVDGAGTGDGSGTTYTDYGSLGGYTISLVGGGTIPGPSPTPSPTPGPTPTPAPSPTPTPTTTPAPLPPTATPTPTPAPSPAPSPTPGPTPAPTPAPTPPPTPVDDPVTFVTPSGSLPAGRLGRRYSGQVRITGSEGPFTWSGFGATPPGLVLRGSASTTSVQITGTPRRTGRFAFALRVTDADGHATQRRFVIRIARR